VNTLRHRGGSSEVVVIVGAGQAGVQAALTLREQNFAGRVVLMGNEPQAPYQRPPLSKKFLANGVSIERLFLRPLAYYAENGIELRMHSQVEGIDRNRGRIHVRGLGTIPYDKLLLATGSCARALNVPGARGADVHYLRSLQDALSLRAKLRAGTRVAIVGGGYIGLEVAATAQGLGARVTVFEGQERVLKRVTSSNLSAFVAQAHQKRGVEIRCPVQVEGFEGDERLEAVIVDGAASLADVAVVGVGAIPNVELAAAAGIQCDNGILVDEHCRSSDQHVYAAGDCTNHPNLLFRSRLRLESVQNATDQATTAAFNMMGVERRHCEVPWFWSNQYHYKIQSAGLCDGHDEIELRGNMEEERFALVYRERGQLLGIDAVNFPREYMAVRNALDHERRVVAPSQTTHPLDVGAYAVS
jgi:3-phenylpropionate/trans-cinnamate dioxygenase ferredoxin reductase subunit